MQVIKEFSSKGSNNVIQRSRKIQKSCINIICGLGLVMILMVCMSYVLEENKNMKTEIQHLRLSFEERLKRSLRKEHQSNVPNQLYGAFKKRRYKRTPAEGSRSVQEIVPTKGVAYYRWGRRDCSGPNSELIYQGIAAGAYFSNTGGASNILCLHMNVSYEIGRYSNGNQGSAYIYGLEYRDSSWVNNIMDMSLTEGNSIQYHSVPCALCLAQTRGTQIMIAAQSQCPEGWTKEYTGFIMSGAHGDKHSSEAICVDDTPQVVPGTSGSNNGAYLFTVETQCNSLLCEPFVAGREVQCVVCTL